MVAVDMGVEVAGSGSAVAGGSVAVAVGSMAATAAVGSAGWVGVQAVARRMRRKTAVVVQWHMSWKWGVGSRV